MDSVVRENWQRIKTYLESVGKTDCEYYRRACASVATGKDSYQPINWPDAEDS